MNSKLENYINDMWMLYDMHKELQEKWLDDLTLPELEDFDYHQSLKFTRTWNIINELKPAQKNLYCAYMLCDKCYKKLMELLGNKHKNEATLRLMISRIKKVIKVRYAELYMDGDVDKLIKKRKRRYEESYYTRNKETIKKKALEYYHKNKNKKKDENNN